MFFMAVLFRIVSYLFGGGIVLNKDIYRRATFSKQVLLHRINFFRRAVFGEKANFFRKGIFRITYFFGELPF